MRKIFSVVLTAAMVFSSMAFTAFANEDESDIVLISAPASDPILISAPVENIQKVTYDGTVDEVGEGYITIKEQKLQFNYDENTLIADYDFSPYSEFKAGDKVTVVADTIMTKSIPAQSYAYYILVNTKDSVSGPIYAKVLSNDGKEIMSDDGQNRIIISDETPTAHYRAKLKIMAKDIPAGAEIFAFASQVGLSMPAYVPAEKIVIVDMGENAGNTESDENTVISQPQEADNAIYNGIVEEIGEGYITLKDQNIRLNYDENSLVADYDFMPYSDIKAGDMVTAVADTVVTMSIPAQSYAHYILVNTKNSAAAPVYAKISSNDGKEMLSADGRYRIAYTDETPTAHYRAKLRIMAAGIPAGSEIFAFASQVGLSMPAYVAPEKIVVVNLAQESEEKADVEKIIVDDEVYEVSFNYAKHESFGTNQTSRFALRPVCEGLGYDVSWDSESQSIKLTKDGAEDVNIQIGVALQRNGQPPMIIDGTTYVTHSLFNILYGADASVEQTDNAIVIKTK